VRTILAGAMALALTAVAWGAPAPPPAALGLVLAAGPQTPPLTQSRFADAIMEAVAASRKWEATVLTEGCALVAASGAVWPLRAEASLASCAGDLQRLAETTRLDDIVVVRLTVAAGCEAEVVWVRGQRAAAKGFTVSVTAPGDAGVVQLARQVVTRIEAGFDSAPSLPAEVPPAVTPSPAPATGPAPGTSPAVAPEASSTAPVPTPAAALPEAPLSEHFRAAEKFLQDGELRKAEDAAQAASDAGDPRAQVCLLFARIEAAKRNTDEERRWLERALAADGALTAAHLRLAELLRAKGLWRKALEEYQAVLSSDPQELHALLGQAGIYGEQGQPRRAAEIVTQALQHSPEDGSLYLRLGDLEAQRNELAQAETAYDRAARLAKSPEDKASALDRLGDLYIGAQRYHEGFMCYAEASRLRSEVSTPLAERRYRQVMSAADEGVSRVLATASQALAGYLADDGTSREEAYAALADLRGQAVEVSSFADTVVAPASLRLEHARRKLAYNLVMEAAISGVVYLDTGRGELLDRYRARLAEAQPALAALGSKS
jgi:tetratricopeptide (TPR) repeat protein